MDKKLIDYSQIEAIFLPNSKMGFATVSPLNAIKGPFIIYAHHGNPTYTSLQSVTQGTIYGCRLGDNENPLKFYGWALSSTGTPALVRLNEIPKQEINFHWSNQLPPKLQNEAPEWVVKLSNEVLESFKV